MIKSKKKISKGLEYRVMLAGLRRLASLCFRVKIKIVSLRAFQDEWIDW